MNIKIVKRSQRTREALNKTLAQMMIKQNINDITIKNLVVLANINRSTFYLHYTDIFDLLQEMENDIISQIQKVLDSYPSLSRAQSYSFVTDLISVFEANRDSLKALMGYHGDAFFIQRMEDVIESKVRKQINLIYCFNKSIAPEYVYSFLRSGCIGMLKTWIFSDCVTPPEEMAVFVYNTVHDIITRLIEDTSK